MAVPNTTTFSLSDVTTELGLTGSNRTLLKCFSEAQIANFNQSYRGDRNNLLNFRDYSNTRASVKAIYTYMYEGYATAQLAFDNGIISAAGALQFYGMLNLPVVGTKLYTSGTLEDANLFDGDGLWYLSETFDTVTFAAKISTTGEILQMQLK